MKSGMANAYSVALDNFSGQMNHMVDREDRLKQQKIENDRWNTTNQRAEESHAATMKNIDLEIESAQRKLDHDKELEDITPALIAKERGGVQGAIDYLGQNPQIVEKYKSTLLPHYTKEQLLEQASTTTQVADFVGSLTSKDKLSGIFQGSPLQERMKVFKEEDLRNQYGISGKDFAAFSATADPLGSPRTKAEVFDTGDGFKGQYALNDKGTPMISGIGLTRDGGIAPIYKINRLDAAGNIVGSYDAPATEGRSLDSNAPVIFRTAKDFKDRADAQQLAVIATQMENRKMVLDPTYAKEVLHGIKTQKNDAAIAAQAEPIIKKLSALKGTATEKEAASLEIFKTASPAVMAYLKTVIELPGKAFEAQGKREETRQIAKDKIDQDERESKRNSADRRYAVDMRRDSDGNGGGKTPAQNASYALWKKVFTNQGMDETDAHNKALELVTEGKSNPSKDITLLATSLLKEGLAKNMTDAITQAKSAYGMLKGEEEKKNPVPAAKGMSVPSAADFDIRKSQKPPVSSFELINSLNSL